MVLEIRTSYFGRRLCAVAEWKSTQHGADFVSFADIACPAHRDARCGSRAVSIRVQIIGSSTRGRDRIRAAGHKRAREWTNATLERRRDEAIQVQQIQLRSTRYRRPQTISMPPTSKRRVRLSRRRWRVSRGMCLRTPLSRRGGRRARGALCLDLGDQEVHDLECLLARHRIHIDRVVVRDRQRRHAVDPQRAFAAARLGDRTCSRG